MSRPSRRDALALGVALTGALLRPRTLRRPALEQLARAFRETPREQVFDVAAEALRAGVSRETFLGAVFQAGVVDVRPRPHGILHCVMEVESNFQLAEATTGREAWLPALWNLDDFKESQARDRTEDGDWQLSARPDVAFASEPAARREFVAAMDAWDPERAELALIGLLPYHDHDSMFELLWPYGMRCNAFIGHKVIYVVQVERALRRIGWAQAEPALRSLVMTVLVDRSTQDYDAARALVPRLGDAEASAGARDPEASAVLLVELRSASPPEAQELVAAAIEEGLHPDTIWDALRLLGSELFLRRPGLTAAAGRNALLPVHGVTVPNAFGHVYRTSASDQTRRIALLQAAAWTARMRADLGRMVGLSMEGPGIDRLGDETDPPADFAELMEAPGAARACAFLKAHPELAPAYSTLLRRSLFLLGVEHHQHKYTAAALEEAEYVDPRWRPLVLAAGCEYIATPGAETDVHARSVAALRKAGLG